MANLKSAKPELVEVELNATSPNEEIGKHRAFMPYGTIEFVDGKAQVTAEISDKLRKDGVIK